MEWKTRVTDILGSKYPIIQGAFGGFGTSAIAAPVSEAGGFGIITAGALRTPQALRDDIRRARDKTDKPFGVNITITGAVMEHASEFADVVIGERVPVLFTAAYKGDEIGRRAKEAGLRWVHKVATVKHALAAERQGAEAVVIVGIEGAGFKSPVQLPILTAITTAARLVKVPLIAAGGIGDAHGFLAALGMGAEGIYMGTRFMATTECPISDRAKQALVDGDPQDPKFRDRALAPPKQELLDRLQQQRAAMPSGEWLQQFERAMLSGAEARQEGLDDDTLVGGAGGSLAVGVIDRVVSVKELISTIIAEAEAILSRTGRLGFLGARAG